MQDKTQDWKATKIITEDEAITNKSKWKHKVDKTGLINDPLSQTHSLASSEHCFLFVLFARF